MAASDASRPRPRRRLGFPLFILAAALFFFFLIFIPNRFADVLVSRICAEASGYPAELRGVRYEFQGKPYMVFSVREIDLRPVWREDDSAVARFVREHDLDAWLLVKDSRWVFRRAGATSYLRLLKAQAGDVSIRGGVRLDDGRVSKCDAAFWLPRSVWGRFPELVEKKFAEDVRGRRLFKLTWNNGRWRLWGRFGPVLEARWQ